MHRRWRPVLAVGSAVLLVMATNSGLSEARRGDDVAEVVGEPMQHPILGVMEGGGAGTEVDPWEFVADGFERALVVMDLGHPQRAVVAECYRVTCRLANRPLLHEAEQARAQRRRAG